MSEENIHLLWVSREYWEEIFSGLNMRDLQSCAHTCQYFRQIATQEIYWNAKVKKIQEIWMGPHIPGQSTFRIGMEYVKRYKKVYHERNYARKVLKGNRVVIPFRIGLLSFRKDFRESFREYYFQSLIRDPTTGKPKRDRIWTDKIGWEIEFFEFSPTRSYFDFHLLIVIEERHSNAFENRCIEIPLRKNLERFLGLNPYLPPYIVHTMDVHDLKAFCKNPANEKILLKNLYLPGASRWIDDLRKNHQALIENFVFLHSQCSVDPIISRQTPYPYPASFLYVPHKKMTKLMRRQNDLCAKSKRDEKKENNKYF
jgi:hypothetical protein